MYPLEFIYIGFGKGNEASVCFRANPGIAGDEAFVPIDVMCYANENHRVEIAIYTTFFERNGYALWIFKQKSPY